MRAELLMISTPSVKSVCSIFTPLRSINVTSEKSKTLLEQRSRAPRTSAYAIWKTRLKMIACSILESYVNLRCCRPPSSTATISSSVIFTFLRPTILYSSICLTRRTSVSNSPIATEVR